MVSEPTWNTIKSLGLEATKTTKRGKRGGRRKQKKLRNALVIAIRQQSSMT